ncbi:golgi traffic protein [Colletotrichum asianum]|uniref:Protein transport protein SFT2 n=1 Tax=Colletotrichum asianum TaxID=702518 RepID=A0A8H3ZGW0_9PEZI|nr:golgi traffic protein [Colletotrichum asianum]
MASSSFRDSINSLGWSRRDQDVPVNTAQQSGLMSSIKSLNPFGNNSYIQLPTTEGAGAPLPAASRREEEEGFATLSRWDRLLIFGACNLGALACFVICFALFPVLSLRPRKFVILWTLGSLLFLASFAAMMGPTAYAKHLISGPRLPFTAAYFGSLGLSLYFSLGHFPDLDLGADSAGLLVVVFSQLFSNGLQWLAPCHHVWGEEGSGMDVGLKKVLTTK